MVTRNPQIELGDNDKFVGHEEAPEHGYMGFSPGIDEDHTVAGVLKAAEEAKKSDEKPAAKKPAAKES